MVLRIEATSSRQYLAVLSAVRAAPKAFQAQIRSQTKQLATPEWRKALAEHAPDRLSHRVIVDSARVNPSNQNIELAAAGVGQLRKGVKNPMMAAPVEFGANRNKTQSYSATSRKGTRYQVTNRHTSNQLRWRNRKGWTFYPAAAQMVPRVAALWAQTVVRTIAKAFEGVQDG